MKRIVTGLALLLMSAAYGVAQQAPDAQSARQISAQGLQQVLGRHSKILVIDVRTPQEFSTGHISGAVNVPLGELAGKLPGMKVPRGTTVVTVCEHGVRSLWAALELQKLGYKPVFYCALDEWRKSGYKLTTSPVSVAL